MRNIIKYFLFPAFFYFLTFIILTYPAILSFSSALFADKVDGLQNVWNIWWVNKAVTQLHQSFWKTNFLHFSYGTTLIGHTLNPFNGILGILLLKFLPLHITYNSVVIFIFVSSGITMFFLSLYLTRSYISSIFAGFVYTFSNYHFAHAAGHLQTISFEWIPLFILSFILFMKKPKIINSLSTVFFLFIILLCDYYYFLYSVLFGLFYFVFKIRKVNFILWFKIYFLPIILFIAGSLIMAGPILLSLFLSNVKDPFSGSHPSALFSADLFGFLIPGGNWRFSNLTKFYWPLLSGNIDEKSFHLGVSVISVLAFLFWKRKKIKVPDFGFWIFTGLFFWVLSLGPSLQIMGFDTHIPLPYAILEKNISLFRLSGMPVRMVSMVILVSALLFSFGIKHLLTQGKKLLIGGIAILLIFEYLPHHFTLTSIEVPGYLRKISSLPPGAVVFDTSDGSGQLLYYQTIHDRPMAYGYIARLGQSVLINDFILSKMLENKDYKQICDIYKIRFLIEEKKPTDNPKYPKLSQIIYEDEQVRIADLSTGDSCL